MARIIVKQVAGGYKAHIEGDTKSWESGQSVDDAVDKMRVSYPELQGTAVHVEG
jgi:hypothetical protein